jgi:hypothetical protein
MMMILRNTTGSISWLKKQIKQWNYNRRKKSFLLVLHSNQKHYVDDDDQFVNMIDDVVVFRNSN